MAALLCKTISIWLMLVILAIVNAAIREKLLAPLLGAGIALPLSGLLLSIFIFAVAYAAIPLFNSSAGRIYIGIGVSWFVLTLAFEILAGHFVGGKPWHDIVQVFNIRKGDLFVAPLITTLISPWLSARLRGLL